MKEKTRHRTIRSLKTAWIECANPEKPILLFLHGYPDSAEAWSYQVDYFKDRFHIVCPYTRGAGPSEGSPYVSRYGRNSVVLDTLNILKSLDPDRKRPVYCIGHDLGAAQAWTVAEFLGQQLAGLVIINGLNIRQFASRWYRPGQWLRSWYIPLMLIPHLPETIADRAPKSVLKLAYSLGGLSKDKQPHGKVFSQRETISQYKALARELPQALSSKVKKLDCPVLVIWGSQDSFLLPPTMEELDPYAKDITVRIFDGNHWIHREQPDKINSALDGFFLGKALV